MTNYLPDELFRDLDNPSPRSILDEFVEEFNQKSRGLLHARVLGFPGQGKIQFSLFAQQVYGKLDACYVRLAVLSVTRDQTYPCDVFLNETWWPIDTEDALRSKLVDHFRTDAVKTSVQQAMQNSMDGLNMGQAPRH